MSKKNQPIKFYFLTILAIVVVIIFLAVLGRLGNEVANLSWSMESIHDRSEEAIESIRNDVLTDIIVMTGQEIYVPAYSNLEASQNQKILDFSITLSIRNTDLKNPIILISIDFYNSEGDKFRPFITEPLEIAPMATRDFKIAKLDRIGGSGTNFYVKWISESLVNEPVVEASCLAVHQIVTLL